MKKFKKSKKIEVQIEKPKNTKIMIRKFVSMLMGEKGVKLAVVANIASSLLYIVMPLVVAVIVDKVVQMSNQVDPGFSFIRLITEIRLPLFILIFIGLSTYVLNFIQERIMARVGESISFKLRQSVTDKLVKLPLSFYDQTQVGELMSKMTSDVDRISDIVVTGFNQFIYAVITIVFGIAILLSINLYMTLVVLILLILCLYATKVISEKNQIAFGVNMATLSELSSTVEEYYTGNIVVKTFNQQDQVVSMIDEKAEAQNAANLKAQFINFSIYPLMRFINQSAFILSAIWGGALAIQGVVSIGMVQAYLQYVTQISEPITQSAYIYNSFQASLASLERIQEILDLDEEVQDDNSDLILQKLHGRVEFEHVEFGYTSDRLLMKDVSFVANPSETIAVVGPTGAGKTTLVNLLMRFYEISAGQIKVDGVNTKDITKKELRSYFGMVLQDTWLFEGTVADNIAYGRPDATRDDVIEAAKQAMCHEFIMKLPEGYETVISSDRSTVSQGQQQLLTIARTILTDPKILILDEATSNIDTKTEIEIQRALNNLMTGKTSFVIAHRLSTIRNADLILVMQSGNIIESGNHETLLAEESFYKDLYNSQFHED